MAQIKCVQYCCFLKNSESLSVLHFIPISLQAVRPDEDM